MNCCRWPAAISENVCFLHDFTTKQLKSGDSTPVSYSNTYRQFAVWGLAQHYCRSPCASKPFNPCPHLLILIQKNSTFNALTIKPYTDMTKKSSTINHEKRKCLLLSKRFALHLCRDRAGCERLPCRPVFAQHQHSRRSFFPCRKQPRPLRPFLSFSRSFRRRNHSIEALPQTIKPATVI